MSFIPSKVLEDHSIYIKIYLQHHKRIIFKVNSSDETETIQYTVYNLAVNNRDDCCELNDEQRTSIEIWKKKSMVSKKKCIVSKKKSVVSKKKSMVMNKKIYGLVDKIYGLDQEIYGLEEEI